MDVDELNEELEDLYTADGPRRGQHQVFFVDKHGVQHKVAYLTQDDEQGHVYLHEDK